MMPKRRACRRCLNTGVYYVTLPGTSDFAVEFVQRACQCRSGKLREKRWQKTLREKR